MFSLSKKDRPFLVVIVLGVASKKFRPDLSVVRVKGLNFVLRSEIFVHYDRQLRASHLILSCMPSYTSYQDLLSAFIVSSPLLSYLDIQPPGFLPCNLTSEEAKQLGPRIARQDFLEPVQDRSTDRVFQGKAVHITLDAPALEDPTEKDPDREELHPITSTLLTLAMDMVQKRSMALDHWFLASQTWGGQPSTQPTSE